MKLETVFAWVLIFALLAVAGWDLRAYATRTEVIESGAISLTQPSEVRIGAVDLYRNADGLVELENFGPVEYRQPHTFRHGYGPLCMLLISSERRHGRLSFILQNRIAGQTITVSCNGRVLEKLSGLPVCELGRSYEFDIPEAGNARFAFEFALYNHAGADIAPRDERPIADTFSTLDLLFQ